MGPQGIGAMLITNELAELMDPVIYGGTGSVSDSLEMPDFLPDKFEPGTLNLPGIIGLDHALKYVMGETPAKIYAHEMKLTKMFLEAVSAIPGVRVIGPQSTEGRVGVVSLSFENTDNADAAFELENSYGIMTRCGLHCAPLAHKTLGTFPYGTVRFAFGYFNTEEEAEYAAECVRKTAVC